MMKRAAFVGIGLVLLVAAGPAPGQFIARDPGVRGGASGAGAMLDGLTAGQQAVFDAGRDDFAEEDTLDSGLGPGPIGALQLRDPGGGWWQLDFADDYTGCGTATFDGEEMGETCAGLSAVDPLNALFESGEAAGW